MLNSLFSDKVDYSAVALQLLEGHQNFLNANTGTTNNAEQDHYVFNPQMVLSNNRHFIAKSQQEAQPNGDATTEGQSLQVIGYCYAYMATRDQKWLTLARQTFDAYINYFYAGKPIPSTPQPYISNWLVNGKEPVLANWPVNFEEPTHSGFKGELLTYSGGNVVIPHGAPYYGEYLDKATFAFVGALGWDAINASVQAIDAAGNIDWANDGIQYDVDWIINWEGKKINWDGDVLSEGHTEAEKGTIQLKDTSVTGQYKTNWANRQPVEFGGFLLERNKPWHNRPLNVPVQIDYLGNAADAEEWFADAAYLLYQITGEQKYWLAWQCVLETTKDYSNIDLYDRFFRASTRDQTPFTDGISYDYSYPSDTLTNYGRTPEGYISMTKAEASQHTIEQQSVWFRIDKNSKLRVQYSGVDNAGAALQARATLSISSQKTDSPTDLKRWVAPLPASTSTNMGTYDIPLYAMVAEVDSSGNDYMMADSRSTFDYGTGVTSTIEYATGILNARQGNVGHARFTNSDSGYGIGFYLTPSGKGQLKSISYRADSGFHLNVVDQDGWRYHWNLTATGTSYRTADLAVANLVANSYQTNPGTPPQNPKLYEIDEFTITPADDNVTNANFYWYAVNNVPPTFSATDGYTIKFNLTISGQTGFTAYVGDCTILDYKANNLAYTPGTIPFSNISVPDTVQFDGWRGMPYPGYQYPFIYCHNRTSGEFDERLNNMTNFMFDSQQWYNQYLGELGPGASAYIWNRWDNLKYGKADTWTMYHWGDDTAWSGYQPRAFFGAARAWYELVIQGRTPPVKLVQYTENWLRWLINYVKEYNLTPTDFPANDVPRPLEDDFTGHMCGLWLAGGCMAALAGCQVPGLDDFIELCVKELQDNFVITGTPDMIMDGAWSPAVRANTGTGPENNGMFFGFWSGEILRGLGLYLLYKEIAPKTNMYTNLKQ